MIDRIRNKLRNDANLRELVLGSLTTFILKASGMLGGYIVILYIAKMMGAESIGMYNIVLSTLTFLAMVSSCGINISILRYAGEFNNPENNNRLRLLHTYSLQIVGTLSFFMGAGLFMLSDNIAVLLGNPAYTSGMKVAGVCLPFFAMALISVEYIRGIKIIKVSEYLRSVNRPLVNLAIISVCISLLNIYNPLLPVYSLAAATIITFVFAELFIIVKTRKTVNYSAEPLNKKDILLTSMPMYVTSISSFLLANFSIFAIEFFYSAKEVGVFSVALKISLLVSLVLTVVNTISAPKFAELYWAGKFADLQKMVNQSAKMIFLVSSSFCFFIMIFSEPLLHFFGPEFIKGKYALIMMLIGQLANAMTGSVGVFMNMTGSQTALRNVVTIVMLISVIANVYAIQCFGIDGAAFIAMLGAITMNLTLAFYVRHKLGFTTYYLPFSATNHSQAK